MYSSPSAKQGEATGNVESIQDESNSITQWSRSTYIFFLQFWVLSKSKPHMNTRRPLSVEEYEAKWGSFFSKGFAPWDSGKPASQLVRFLEESRE